MTDLNNITDHGTENKLTAPQVENDCPEKLQGLGKRIKEHLSKAAKCDDKAEQHRISAGQLLAEAQKSCDDDGFTAFREKFFPKLGKSRVYELLQIVTDKKSLQEVRAETQECVAKHRANKAASVTVTENSDTAGAPQEAPAEAVTVEGTSIVPNQAPEPAGRRSGVNPKDDALFDFTKIVLELIRRTAKGKVKRFATTPVPVDDLAKLGKFLTDLANFKKSSSLKPAAPGLLHGNGTVSPEQSGEAMKAEHAANDAEPAALEGNLTRAA